MTVTVAGQPYSVVIRREYHQANPSNRQRKRRRVVNNTVAITTVFILRGDREVVKRFRDTPTQQMTQAPEVLVCKHAVQSVQDRLDKSHARTVALWRIQQALAEMDNGHEIWRAVIGGLTKELNMKYQPPKTNEVLPGAKNGSNSQTASFHLPTYKNPWDLPFVGEPVR